MAGCTQDDLLHSLPPSAKVYFSHLRYVKHRETVKVKGDAFIGSKWVKQRDAQEMFV
jgi:hypothetical protein